jgi:nucleoside-diphosphate-sugar epimerase
MKRILITGGAGFIGYHLSNYLSSIKDNYVYIIDNLKKNNFDDEFKKLLEKDNVDFQKKDLSRPSSFSDIENVDQVYHLAAIVGVRKVMEDPVETIRVNTLSTIYLLERIKEFERKPKLLFTSSCENYAGTINSFNYTVPTPEEVPLCIDDVTNPRWSYAASKILGEVACMNYSKKCGFDNVVVRYHNIYGPRMGYDHVIPDFITRLKKDPKRFEMFGGYQSRSFCYVSDAIKMTAALMDSRRANGKVVNVGNDKDVIRIDQIAKMICEMMGINPEIIEKGHLDGSVEKRIPDTTLIKELGCYHSNVNFEEGLSMTYKWYERNEGVN